MSLRDSATWPSGIQHRCRIRWGGGCWGPLWRRLWPRSADSWDRRSSGEREAIDRASQAAGCEVAVELGRDHAGPELEPDSSAQTISSRAALTFSRAKPVILWAGRNDLPGLPSLCDQTRLLRRTRRAATAGVGCVHAVWDCGNLLRQGRFVSGKEKIFVAHDFAIEGGLHHDLQAARDNSPPGVEIIFPAQEGRHNGEIWRNLLRPSLLEATRIIAYLDLPNANVGFEIGYALGGREGKKLMLARAGTGDLPQWTTLPPLTGFMCRCYLNGIELLRAISVEENWYVGPRRPKRGAQVVLLCPKTAGENFRDLFKTRNWVQPRAEGWNLNDLPGELDGAGAVVWVILSHKDGAAARDGAENAALSIIAGYAHACDLPLFVLKDAGSRVVVDVQWKAREFRSRQEFSQNLLEVDELLRAQQSTEPIDVVGDTMVPAARPGDLGTAPSTDFGRIREEFIGRQLLLADLRDACDGLILRQRGQSSSGRRDVRVAWYHGFGGIGKSWFLRRALLDIQDHIPDAKVGFIDWDDAQLLRPLVRPPTTPSEVLLPIAYRLAQLYGTDALDPYWSACQRAEQAAAERAMFQHRFQSQVERLRLGDDWNADPLSCRATIGEALRVVLANHDLPTSGETRLTTLTMLRDESLRAQVFEQWCDREGGVVSDREAVLDPDGLRLHAVRDCLRKLAAHRPLVLLLDTCELLKSVTAVDLDGVLRNLIVPLCTGPLPFLLAIASRFPPDAGSVPGTRDSWRDRLSPQHLCATPFDESLRFTSDEISMAASKLNLVAVSGEVARRIHQVTLGVPLAVRTLFDASLYGGPDELEHLLMDPSGTGEVDHLSKRGSHEAVARTTAQLVGLLSERVDRQADYHALITLALFKELDHEVLGRLWKDGQVGRRLSDFGSRYGLLSNGDLPEAVRNVLRRLWRFGHRDEQVHAVIDHFAEVVGESAVAGNPGQAQYFRRLALRFDAAIWKRGDAAASGFAPVFAVSLAFGKHVAELLALIDEIPWAPSSTYREELRMLQRLAADQGSFASAPWREASLMAWLRVEHDRAPEDWTADQKAALLLLEGLALAEGEQKRRAAAPLMAALRRFKRLPAIPRAFTFAGCLFDVACALGDTTAGDAALALVVYEAAVSAGYDEAMCANNRGRILYTFGHIEEAEEQFRLACELKPGDPLHSRNLGWVLVAEGRVSEGEACLRKSVELDPSDLSSYLALAAHFRRQAREADAEAVLRQAVAANPLSGRALCALGEALVDADRTEAAQQAFTQARALGNAVAEARNGFGRLQLAAADLSAAEESFRTAVSLEPGEPVYHYNLGAALERRAQNTAAEASYRRALELNHRYSRAADKLTALLERTGRKAEADEMRQRFSETTDSLAQHSISLAYTGYV
jgi:Flp pilus assembly protein TadD